MYWKWCRPGQLFRSAPFVTEEDARDHAVKVAMGATLNSKGGKSQRQRFARMTRSQKDQMWKALEREGWRTGFAP